MRISIQSASVVVTDITSGVSYSHDFVTNISIDNPRMRALTVSPQGFGKGIQYATGLTSPISCNMTVRGMPNELSAFYINAYTGSGTDRDRRFDVMILDTVTGERYDLNNSIINSDPRVTNITEGEGSLDQALSFSTPPSGFAYTAPSVEA